jgi:capsular polysaccharide biosynthesis protein/Mrp family chromosome partitioning ATPase
MTKHSSGRPLRSLLKLAILPAVGVLAGVAAALMVTSLIAPTYRATSSVIIKPVVKKKSASQVGDVTLALNLAPSVARLAESREVARETARQLRIPENEVFGKVTATSEPGNQIVKVEVEGGSGPAVAAIANAAAQATGRLFADLRPSGTSTISVKALDEAAIPLTPAAPRPLLNDTLGAAAGLLIGIGIGSLLGRSEDRFRRLVDVEHDLALPTLAAIRRLPVRRGGSASRFYQRRDKRLITDGLLAALSILGAGLSQRTPVPNTGVVGRRIIISSVGDDRATPFIAALLAVSLSKHSQGTAVVEGEFRRRGLARYTRGRGVRTVDYALGDGQTADANDALTVLPIDEITEYFGQQPRPEQLAALVDALAANIDNVVVTAPPVLTGPGLTALAEHADIAILVVASNRVNRAEAGRAALLVRRLGVHLAGTVVTGAAIDEDGWQPSAWKDPEVDESADRAVRAGARRAAALVRTDETAGQLIERPGLKITS